MIFTHTLPSGKVLKVEDVEFDRYSDRVVCAGFGRVVISDFVWTGDIIELDELLGDEFKDAKAWLDELATEACRAWDEQRQELRRTIR